MSILSSFTSFISDSCSSAAITINNGLDWTETALIDGLDLWIGFLLDQPQFALIGLSVAIIVQTIVTNFRT